MTIRSNSCNSCNWLMNVANLLLAADSGVTKMTLALSYGLWLFQTTLDIMAFSHLSCKSPCNATNGTTTMVLPPDAMRAGNMNNKLLPPPVPMMTITGLWPLIMASIAGFCIPRNFASLPTMISNPACILACFKCFHRNSCISLFTSSQWDLFRLTPTPTPNPCVADGNPKNRCPSWLTCLYFSFWLCISNWPSNNNLAYIIPAIRVPWPDCKSHALSPWWLSSSKSSHSSDSSLLLSNLYSSLIYFRVMAIAICLHALIFNFTPIRAMLSLCMIFLIHSDVHAFCGRFHFTGRAGEIDCGWTSSKLAQFGSI